MPSGTFYADVESISSVVGPFSGGWEEQRNSQVGGSVSNLSTGWVRAIHDGLDYRIARIFMRFDASIIGAQGTITGGTVSFHVYASNGKNFGGFGIVTHSVPGVAGVNDYGSVGSTELTTTRASNPALGEWCTLTLNAAGISAISTTGTTALALRASRDLDNVLPTGWENGTECDYLELRTNWEQWYPKLDLTWTNASGIAPHYSDRTLFGGYRKGGQ